jgi:3-hydroxyacyl-[acyl-carrier-protein] dehydratase
VRDAIERSYLDRAGRDTEGNPVFTFRFAADEPVFGGHFPGRPLLPGVFQLEMARAAAEWTEGRPLAIRSVDKAKFTRPVLPDETIRLVLRLEKRGDGLSARARLFVGDEPAGESLLTLEG